MGCLRFEPLHDIHRPHQFHFRHRYLSGDVVCVRMPKHGTSNAVPIRMVYRRLAVADPDCAHDTYPETPLHTKLCLLASNRTYPADYGHRYPAAFHPVWKLYRTGSTAIKLFPLALRYPVVLLHTDSIIKNWYIHRFTKWL